METASPHLSLSDMIQFSQLLLRFQEVIRAIYLPRRDNKENDVEHSYHLAMMAWYLNSSGRLGYDTDKIIQYALVHDLVEAYAGDVSALDLEARRDKDRREAEALARIEAEFPQAGHICDSIRRYEARADDEAKFVYALDKLMPMLMIYLSDGRTWREEKQDFALMHNCQSDKIALSAPVRELYDQLKVILTSRPQLFGSA
jgi:putative hydrolase of HD superfamily